ncbi:MAG: hypothetical protein HY350_05355, partial [Candidatus Omnitrophica bacterium]|nr:hypothetical protein [Candidatus Omnitrophota bacterium]
GGMHAVFEWKDMDLKGELKVIDVKISVDLPKDSGIAEWRIWINNNSNIWGLWEIEFPKVNGFLESGQYDLAIPMENWGVLKKNVTSREWISWGVMYPHGYSGAMQFLCALKGENGVYMAAHDSAAWRKDLICVPGEQFLLRTIPEDMGIPGSDYNAPYPAMLGVYRGGWFEGCKIYRKFAITAPWTGGSISRRKEKTSLKDIALWLRVGDLKDTEKEKESILNAQKFFDIPASSIGVHWYFWHSNIMDDGLPDYLPPKPGHSEVWQDLVKRGFVIMPYINGRVISETAKDFEAYKPYLCKKYSGEPYEEKWGQDMDYAVCPYTEFWQDKMVEIVEGLVDAGANAIYFDQISGEPPLLCFDSFHGHPLGGGSWWTEGYAKMIDKCRNAARDKGRDILCTGEFPAEPYNLDGFLVWTTRTQNSIPMLTTVYSGYNHIYFGSNTFFDVGNRAWIMREGRDFLWGIQNGWMDPSWLMKPEYSVMAGFLKKICKYRIAGKKFLAFGELSGLIAHPHETVTEKWSEGETALPVIQGSVWKAEDGSLGIFLVNYINEERSIEIEIEPVKYGMEPGQKGYKITQIDTEGNLPKEKRILDADKIILNETIGPWDIRLLEVKNGDK